MRSCCDVLIPQRICRGPHCNTRYDKLLPLLVLQVQQHPLLHCPPWMPRPLRTVLQRGDRS